MTVAAACIVSSTAWAGAGEMEPAGTMSGKAVVQSLRELGLTAAGDKGYLQTLRYREQVLLPERSSLVLAAGGTEARLALGSEAALDMSVQQPARLDAGLVFIGYGLPSVMGSRDDFSGRDLRGKVAVYVDATPLFLSADQARSARALAQAAAERAGALGLIAVDVSEERWAARRQAWNGEGRYLAESALQPTRAPQLVAAVAPAAAARLFSAAGQDLGLILAAARAGRPLPAFTLDVVMRATTHTRTRTGSADAVVAMLPGADAYLGRNSVVLSANASDAQALLRLARDAKAAGASRRSIVFALLPAELRGDLAARALVERLGASRDSVVAALHLEGCTDGGVAVASAGESSLGETARTLAANLGLNLRAADGSDAAAGFAAGGTPALGLQASGAESYLAALAREIADGVQRPSWRPDSPFAPPAPRAQENLVAPLEMPVGKRPQKILPSYGALRPTSLPSAA
jgi:hypothetical protein